MKREMLKYLLLEETRLHSALRGSKSFLLYPFLILLGTAATAFAMARYTDFLATHDLAPSAIAIFFMFGIMSGSFGLHAIDYLEKRFGDFGKLFSNMLVLPIRLRDIFLMTAISDAIFYFGWYILPIIGGSATGLALAGASIARMPLLLLCVALAFIMGIGLSFLLSVLITKSKTAFFTALAAIVSLPFITGKGAETFPPYTLYNDFSLVALALNLAIIVAAFAITGLIIGNEYATIRRKGTYTSHRFGKANHFLLKEYIDLQRTHGLFAKPLFNVIGPSVLLLLILGSADLFEGGLSILTHNLIFVAIVLGIMSVNFFNVIMSGDSFSYYIFLPLSLKSFVWPKILLAGVISALQGIALLLIYAGMKGTWSNAAASIILLGSFTYYTLCTNFLINGLKPNENSMNIGSLWRMALLFLPAILIGMLLPFLTASFLIFLGFAGALVAIGSFFYTRGLKKWDPQKDT